MLRTQGLSKNINLTIEESKMAILIRISRFGKKGSTFEENNGTGLLEILCRVLRNADTRTK